MSGCRIPSASTENLLVSVEAISYPQLSGAEVKQFGQPAQIGTPARPWATAVPAKTSGRSADWPCQARQAYGEVDPDGSRYLLGDHMGRLYLLVLVKDQGTVSGLKLEPLGTTSAASTLSCASPPSLLSTLR